MFHFQAFLPVSSSADKEDMGRIWGSAYHVPFGRSWRLEPSQKRLSVRGVTEVEQDSQIWIANLGDSGEPSDRLKGAARMKLRGWYNARPHISIRRNADNCGQP